MQINKASFNDRLLQILLLAIIIVLGLLVFLKLYSFLPGLLGGITLYILSRKSYFQLIFKRKWKKGWAAMLYIFIYIIVISIPIYISVMLVTPKINEFANNQEKIIEGAKIFSERIEKFIGFEIITEQTARNATSKITAYIPKVLNSTASVVTNLIMMFFLLYYLLVNGKEVERYLSRIIPLQRKNIDALASETKTMIRASAIGIPIICIVQGLVATLGYWMFGVEDWALWGFITGVFAYFPIVGTMIVWIPVVLFMLASGHNSNALFLTIYSIVVTGNVDYLTRLTLMKKLGDIHPMITVLGVIVGLNLFGFIGLIFGPLLVSYFIILVKIYYSEFSDSQNSIEVDAEADKN
ncbi:MAG: AI-2E family transporter [Chitinophagaceae bacterium]|nr:MAG: AI-2E family transporter [Chitinophagaceae bacterium]